MAIVNQHKKTGVIELPTLLKLSQDSTAASKVRKAIESACSSAYFEANNTNVSAIESIGLKATRSGNLTVTSKEDEFLYLIQVKVSPGAKPSDMKYIEITLQDYTLSQIGYVKPATIYQLWSYGVRAGQPWLPKERDFKYGFGRKSRWVTKAFPIERHFNKAVDALEAERDKLK